ncbi:MAG TPA: hypothetical protein VMT89_02115 [Candidatus Acidoferrales bacterium]|nr:hypothetical protein [Candidatus Acidoferrales bacterium]
MTTAAAMTYDLSVSDVSGQRTFKASKVPASTSIAEFISSALARMGLARLDYEGKPLKYAARVEREGRMLNGSELIGDALLPDDELTLAPDVDAGGVRQ